MKAAAEKWLDASCDSCLYFPCHLKVKDIRKCFGLKHFTYIEPHENRVI